MKRFAQALSIPCLLLFLWLPQVHAQAQPALPEGTAAKLQAAVTDLVRQNPVPGLSVAVAHNGRVVWCTEAGKADLEHDVPVTRATKFRLASVSKPVTAVAVMRLVEKGKIDLDAPVQKYVPDFPAKAWPITVRQLLCHTSGIRHYRPRESESTRRYASLSQGLDIFKNDDLLFEPGTKQGYSTYAYTLLGCVLEKASGKSFVDCLLEEVLEPAGMANTHADDVYAVIPHRARGYARVGEGRFRNAGLMDSGYKIPGGGLLAPAEDLAKFAAALQNGKLLQDKTVAQMATRQKLKDGKEIAHGLGWRIDGTGALAHGGAQQGTSAFLLFDRPNKVGVAVLANSEGVGPALSRLSVQLADIVAEVK
jgi:serine beta-lactamase-like protein LACTB, mitochondrial